MTQILDFVHSPYQVVCIATRRGVSWSSAAMLMRLDSPEFDDRPRWFGGRFPTPALALAHAQRQAIAQIDAGEAGLTAPLSRPDADVTTQRSLAPGSAR